MIDAIGLAATNGGVLIEAGNTNVETIKLNATAGGVKLNAALDGNAAAIHLDSASGVTIAGGDNNDSIFFENSPLRIHQITAPTTVTDKLYNVGGTLFFNGVALGAGSRVKGVYNLASTGSMSEIDLNTRLISGGNDDLNYSSVGYDPDRIDVFLNGVLLVSGNLAQVHSSVADYTVDAAAFGGIAAPTASIRFGFDVTLGDTVQVTTS